jgi:hypothetical protein
MRAGSFAEEDNYFESARTAQDAICRAAVRAVAQAPGPRAVDKS